MQFCPKYEAGTLYNFTADLTFGQSSNLTQNERKMKVGEEEEKNYDL